jgi:hypothetical protein
MEVKQKHMLEFLQQDNLSGINTLAWPYIGPTAAARDWNAGPCS